MYERNYTFSNKKLDRTLHATIIKITAIEHHYFLAILNKNIMIHLMQFKCIDFKLINHSHHT